jgi:hypothetical protein
VQQPGGNQVPSDRIHQPTSLESWGSSHWIVFLASADYCRRFRHRFRQSRPMPAGRERCTDRCPFSCCQAHANTPAAMEGSQPWGSSGRQSVGDSQVKGYPESVGAMEAP